MTPSTHCSNSRDAIIQEERIARDLLNGLSLSPSEEPWS